MRKISISREANTLEYMETNSLNYMWKKKWTQRQGCHKLLYLWTLIPSVGASLTQLMKRSYIN